MTRVLPTRWPSTMWPSPLPEQYGHEVHARGQHRLGALDLAGDLVVGEAPQHLGEHRAGLAAGQGRPQAEVLAEAEGHVRGVGFPGDVEDVGPRPGVL